VHAPLSTDYVGNPWTPIVEHGAYNPLVTLSSSLVHSGLWGGDIVVT
jgi:hypothetical protein